jgi:hypothetical protein
MIDFALFPIIVAVVGFFWLRSRRSIPKRLKRQALPKLVGVAGVAVAVAQSPTNPGLYAAVIAVAVAVYFLPG